MSNREKLIKALLNVRLMELEDMDNNELIFELQNANCHDCPFEEECDSTNAHGYQNCSQFILELLEEDDD